MGVLSSQEISSPAGVSTPRPVEDAKGLVDVERAVARREHVADLARSRVVFGLASVCAVLFFGFDVAHVAFMGTGDLRVLFSLRVLVSAWLFVGWWRTRRRPPISERELDVLLFGTLFVTLSVIAAMCVQTGGLTSYYAISNLLVMTGTSYVPRPWRRTAVPVIASTLCYPTILLGSAFVSDLTRAQLADTRAVYFALVMWLLLVSAAVFVIGGGHLVWTVRHALAASRSIGRYRLRRRIGRGGMGEVWAAWHRSLGREVAVKILRIEGEPDDVAGQRFEREVRATAELAHPNTVRVFDYGATDDGLLYYAMELLDGEHLKQLVAREGPLPVARALHIVSQAARALAEAHRRGIVHRDVKPENLFITDAGGEKDFVKVIDFGVAKRTSIKEAELTQFGAIAGTPSTMSPEAITLGEIGPPADVYGLGAVLYFCLTARYPFEGEAASQLVAHLHDAVLPPSLKTDNEIPSDVEAVVMRALEKEPTQRFADCAKMADALARCAAYGTWHPEAVAARAKPSTRPPPPMSSPDAETLHELPTRIRERG